MACRVGMSTSPGARIQYWKNREGHTYSKIPARGLTYKQAQEYKKRVAKAKGCKQSSGGAPVADKVCPVYYVSGGVRFCLMGCNLFGFWKRAQYSANARASDSHSTTRKYSTAPIRHSGPGH